MRTRIITAVILFILALPALLLHDTPLLLAYMLFLACVATYELLSATGLKNSMAASFLSLAYTIFLLVPFRVLRVEYPVYALGASFVYLFLMFGCSVLSHGKTDIAVAAETAAYVVYVSLGFAVMGRIHDMRFGFIMFLFIFISAFATDIFAYFTGRLIGRHKLIPDVSPNKTVEGAIGGIVGCVLVTILYILGLGLFIEETPEMLLLSLIAIPIAIVSQLGDLIMSQIKRRHQIKDFGKIFPGHGGVLDRFDSAIAVAYFLYMLWGMTGNSDVPLHSFLSGGWL